MQQSQSQHIAFFFFFFISPTHGARLVRVFFYGFQGETFSTCSLHVFVVMPKFSRNRSISNGFQDIDFFLNVFPVSQKR